MFASPFHAVTGKTEQKLTFTLLYMLIIGIIVMAYFDSKLITEVAPHGMFSFEQAGSPEKSKEIINSWSNMDRVFAGLSLGFDFLFLLVYTLFISLLTHKVNEQLWVGKPAYRIGSVLIWSMFITAIFDGVENVALIKLLIGNYNEYWSWVAYSFSLAKFILIGISLVYLIINGSYYLIKKFTNE